MIAPDFNSGVERLAHLIESAIVPFTGAGISTECGIPDFRSPGGLSGPNMRRSRSTNSCRARKRGTKAGAGVSRWTKAVPGHSRKRAPGARQPIQAGKIPGVVTQNIDNLHQASGVAAKDVCELHGNTSYAACLECNKRYELKWVKDSFDQSGHAPECVDCDGYIKTATVVFGQSMPVAAMRHAESLTMSADLFFQSVRRWWCGRRPDFR